jgi:putative membrane protein
MLEQDATEAPGPAGRFQVRTTAESHFAWLRTRLAVERTMMAYLRTAVSLIGFGFGLFQFAYQQQGTPDFDSVRFPGAAWYLGLALIACGVLSAVFSTVEYRRMLRYLWGGSYAPIAGLDGGKRNTPMYTVSFVLVLVGLFAFFTVLFRMG